MIRRNVVTQHGQGTHSLHCTNARQRPFPVRRATDIRGRSAPIVQRRHTRGFFAGNGEHRFVDFAKHVGLHAGLHNRVDFFIGRPNVLQANLLAIDDRQYVFLNIETNRARDGIGHHQRRRREKRLFGVGMNTTIEIAVT